MSYRSALAAIDRRFPNRALFRATYRIPNVAQTVLELEAAFRIKFGLDKGFTQKKYVLNDTYTVLCNRGFTSGYAFALMSAKDDSGKLIALASVSRTSKITHGAGCFAALIAGLAFVACTIGIPAFGAPFPFLVNTVIALVVTLVTFLAIFHLFMPLTSAIENLTGGRLPDETMNEIVGTFREIVEKNGELIEIQ